MASLDPAAVPSTLRSLLPLAARWGIGDDYEREAAVDAASPAERAELVQAVDAAPDLLWQWLVAEDADVQAPEYQALTCLTMAADSARQATQRQESEPG